MIILTFLGWNIRFNVPYILLDAFIDDLFPHDCVKQHVEFNDNFFQIVSLVGFLLCDEKSIFFFEDVLDLAYDMRSPYDLPVFLRVLRLFVQSFSEVLQQENSIRFP